MSNKFEYLKLPQLTEFLKRNKVKYNWNVINDCSVEKVKIMFSDLKKTIELQKNPPSFLNEIQVDWVVDKFFIYYENMFMTEEETLISDEEIEEMFSAL